MLLTLLTLIVVVVALYLVTGVRLAVDNFAQLLVPVLVDASDRRDNVDVAAP